MRSSAANTPIARVSACTIYPIKSCAGVELSEVRLTPRGLEHDRTWMLVDPAGVFVTQRNETRLCRVTPSLTPSGFALDAPGVSRFELPWTLASGGRRTVRVWNDSVAVWVSAEGSAWFSDFLQRPVTLVCQPEQGASAPAGARRGGHPDYATADEQLAFQDAFPVLLISEASLAGLNARLEERLPMSRFRPNLVVSDCAAHAEDAWRRVRVGEVVLRGTKPCDRCSVTTVDAATARRGKEPLRALSLYRQWDGKVWFGMNFSHENAGSVRVGDPVHALA